MIDHIAIIGAGSGGKAAAVDLALQGKHQKPLYQYTYLFFYCPHLPLLFHFLF